MKKVIIITLLTSLLLYGCGGERTTRNDAVNAVNAWVGEHIDKFIKNRGMPDFERKIMGKNVYTWDMSQTVVTPGYSGVYSPGYGATANTTGSIIGNSITTQTTINPGKPARMIGARKSSISIIKCGVSFTVNKNGYIESAHMDGCGG